MATGTWFVHVNPLKRMPNKLKENNQQMSIEKIIVVQVCGDSETASIIANHLSLTAHCS